MADRSADWMAQAVRDLEKAEGDMEREYFEWACFTAHQAAEKAMKSLYLALAGEAWGHTISALMKKLPAHHQPNPSLIEDAIQLDRFYIPTRYPNGFDSGSPKDYFTKRDAQNGVDAARRIIEFCQSQISGQA